MNSASLNIGNTVAKCYFRRHVVKSIWFFFFFCFFLVSFLKLVSYPILKRLMWVLHKSFQLYTSKTPLPSSRINIKRFGYHPPFYYLNKNNNIYIYIYTKREIHVINQMFKFIFSKFKIMHKKKFMDRMENNIWLS